MRNIVAATALALVAANAPVTAHDQSSDASVFPLCDSGPRVTCVVDGDTFWFRGDKIRLTDINTPEVSQPGCPEERALGERARQRLAALLGAGPFTLQASGRHRDRYGRLLRVVLRDGESLGAILVREGLAEQWQGRRGDWCTRLALAR